MPFYEVRKGYTWGIEKKPAGSLVFLSVEDAKGFEFKLTPVPDSAVEERNRAEAKAREITDKIFRVNPVETVTEFEEVDGVEWAELPDGIIDSLEEAGIDPEAIPEMSDITLLAIEGIGPASLKKIRAAYPKKG